MSASQHNRQERYPAVLIPAMSRVLAGGDTLFAIATFLGPSLNDGLCIIDIKPMMMTLAQMSVVCRTWNAFVHHTTDRWFDTILHHLQTHSPAPDCMRGGYRLYKFLASRITAFPQNHSREFLQILGTLSASAQELMDYIHVCRDDDNPEHLMALPSGDDVKGNCDRSLSLHLIGSHVIGEDYLLSRFCADVTRRLQQHDHSGFAPDVLPSTIVHQRIVGYLVLYKEVQDMGLGPVQLRSNNLFQWNTTLRQALTAVGRDTILQVLLQDHCTSAREAGCTRAM
jgi:hypothetical protein